MKIHDQVYNRADHDEPHPEGLPWVYEWGDEADRFFATEDDACAAQREKRAANGLDPITGEAVAA